MHFVTKWGLLPGSALWEGTACGRFIRGALGIGARGEDCAQGASHFSPEGPAGPAGGCDAGVALRATLD